LTVLRYATYVAHAFSEQSFTRMEIIRPAESGTRTFDPDNLYGAEVEDFIALLDGQPSVGTTLEEACRSLLILEAITESYRIGRAIAVRAAEQ